jgi:hypothetical protein
MITTVLSRLATGASRAIAASTVALSAALIQTPALAAPLHLVPLHRDDWALAAVASLLAVIPLAIAERS